MLNAMDRMMGFAKTDPVRIVSYDTFVLIITVALNPVIGKL